MRPTIRGYPSKAGSMNLYPYFPLEDTVHSHNNHDFKCLVCQNRRVKVHDIEFILIDTVDGRRVGWGIWYPREFIEHGKPGWASILSRC